MQIKAGRSDALAHCDAGYDAAGFSNDRGFGGHVRPAVRSLVVGGSNQSVGVDPRGRPRPVNDKVGEVGGFSGYLSQWSLARGIEAEHCADVIQHDATLTGLA